MNEIYNKYLPIGTVVLLKNGKKRVMITGFCSIANDNKNKVYDYSGCTYPEGFFNSNQALLFNHEQITKICHLGLIDDEEKKFKEIMKEKINKVQNNILN